MCDNPLNNTIIYSATPTPQVLDDEICEQPLILILEKAATKGVFKYYISVLGGEGGGSDYRCSFILG